MRSVFRPNGFTTKRSVYEIRTERHGAWDMKRVWTVAVGAVLGLALVVGLHSKTRLSALPPGQVGQRSATGAAPPRSGSSRPAASSPPPGASNAPSRVTKGSASGSSSNSAVGSSEQYGYGVLSVKVTVSANKITDVTVVNLQTADQYSQQLASQVIPMLKSEVMSAQSANINGISGATYTSEAYATSLQSALKKLKFK